MWRGKRMRWRRKERWIRRRRLGSRKMSRNPSPGTQ